MQVPRKRSKAAKTSSYLDGQILIAMPSMTDKRFQRSIIYLCAHSSEGAMGLILNQRAKHISFPQLLGQLKIAPARPKDSIIADLEARQVLVGGPVESGRGFVLHSSDYFAPDSTLAIDSGICLTATVDILRAMATGKGPDKALLALGYAGWSPGQLEGEIHANGWLNCPADMDLVFGDDLSGKYERAMLKMGINPIHLVSEAGHA